MLIASPAPAHAQTSAFDIWRQADTATRQAALALARRAFDAYALRREVVAPPAGLPPCFAGRAAVFVSAMQNGAPRCCMGTLYPTQPTTADEIIASAVAAAGRDHRFAPIKPAELGRLRLIVSLLSPPRPLGADQLSTLNPARDGLVVQNGDRSGVVLSGETARVSTMLAWGRTRAGASVSTPVQLFRIQSVRFVEPPRPRAVPRMESAVPRMESAVPPLSSPVAAALRRRNSFFRRCNAPETPKNSKGNASVSPADCSFLPAIKPPNTP